MIDHEPWKPDLMPMCIRTQVEEMLKPKTKTQIENMQYRLLWHERTNKNKGRSDSLD